MTQVLNSHFLEVMCQHNFDQRNICQFTTMIHIIAKAGTAHVSERMPKKRYQISDSELSMCEKSGRPVPATTIVTVIKYFK
jgi:hypothetical protein